MATQPDTGRWSMKIEKARKRDKARRKRRSRKPDSGRSVFVIQQIQIDRARKKARKEKDELLQR